MSEYRIEFNPWSWVRLPHSFPTEDEATREEWIENILREVGAASGAMSDAQGQAIRGLADFCLQNIDSDASESFWFCPRIAPSNAIVHVTVQALESGVEPTIADILGDGEAVLPANVEFLTTDNLGLGFSVRRVVQPIAGIDDVRGQVVFAFNPDGWLVTVEALAADLTALGVMEEELHRLVSHIRIESAA